MEGTQTRLGDTFQITISLKIDATGLIKDGNNGGSLIVVSIRAEIEYQICEIRVLDSFELKKVFFFFSKLGTDISSAYIPFELIKSARMLRGLD